MYRIRHLGSIGLVERKHSRQRVRDLKSGCGFASVQLYAPRKSLSPLQCQANEPLHARNSLEV